MIISLLALAKYAGPMEGVDVYEVGPEPKLILQPGIGPGSRQGHRSLCRRVRACLVHAYAAAYGLDPHAGACGSLRQHATACAVIFVVPKKNQKPKKKNFSLSLSLSF